MRVNVYSRAPKVRLYQDGVAVGEADVNPETYTATFKVDYKPGELRAVNLNGKREAASVTFETTGAPASIRLVADRTTIGADRNDLSYVKIEIVDEAGRLIPDAAVKVNLAATGNGRIIASGNGAYDDMESFRSPTPTTFRGRAIAILQPTEQQGSITLTVSAEGLPDSTIEIETR